MVRDDHPMQDVVPPIQNLDAFDIVGELKGGGVDLVISCVGPLDSSATTLILIERKVMAYLATIAHERFAQVYPAAKSGFVSIYISCEYYVSPPARDLIERLRVIASKRGVGLSLVSSMEQRLN